MHIMSELAHHYEASALVQAPMDEVFTYVDDPARLSSHMSESSRDDRRKSDAD